MQLRQERTRSWRLLPRIAMGSVLLRRCDNRLSAEMPQQRAGKGVVGGQDESVVVIVV